MPTCSDAGQQVAVCSLLSDRPKVYGALVVFRRSKSQPSDDVPEILRVGGQLAARDGVACQVAEEAVGDWLKMFPAVANAAGASDAGATTPARMLIEAFSAAGATREALAAGDDAEALFGEQAFIAQEHAAGGVTKEWTVAFWQLRCIAIGYMLGALGERTQAERFGLLFREQLPPVE